MEMRTAFCRLSGEVSGVGRTEEEGRKDRRGGEGQGRGRRKGVYDCGDGVGETRVARRSLMAIEGVWQGRYGGHNLHRTGRTY